MFGDNAFQQSPQIVQDPGVCHLVKFIKKNGSGSRCVPFIEIFTLTIFYIYL